MSSQHNNPITNSIDFTSHGTKSTSIGNVENQFNVTQSGSSSDPRNTALSAYSLQSDMLTSAYFNSEVGDLRETLGAYQIKVSDNKHRAIFVGGTNYRDGNSTTQVDVNVGNYPLDITDTDTNTGKKYSENQGIPNMTLKGNSFKSQMPIFPLTKTTSPEIKANESNINATVLSQFQNEPSLWDAIQLLKTIFTLNTIKINIGTNGSTTPGNSSYFELDTTTGLGSVKFNKTTTSSGYYEKIASNVTSATNNNCVTNIRTPNTGFLGKDVYVSLTRAVTQWVRVSAIQVTIDDISNKNYDGLLNTSGNSIPIPTVTGFQVKLILDGKYGPRQMIGNGMSHQQLFIWNESGVGNKTTAVDSNKSTSWIADSYLQFSLSNYLVYNKNASSNKTTAYQCSVTRDTANHKKITLDASSASSSTIPTTAGKYLWVAGTDPLNTSVIYKITSVSNSGTTYTIELDRDFSNTVSGNSNTTNYYVTELTTTNIEYMKCHKFNIDEIRDRYSMLQLISHLGAIYRTATNLSMPLKIVEYMSQVLCNTNLSNLLYYVSLCELYSSRTSSTVDIGKRLNQIFHFIQNDNNYQNALQGGNRGVKLRYWNDLTDSNDISPDLEGRFTCLNTNPEKITPSTTDVNQLTSYNIARENKVKHVVITNLPGFDNGRYGSTMSSSNMIHGYFGSLSIDLSYSDTHTPVDINGMTVHQWNYDNNNNGLNNPSRWNVNADESYRSLVTNASNNC